MLPDAFPPQHIEQALLRRAIERDAAAIARWQEVDWPRLKKTRRERCTIVFIDESGLRTRPHRVRTWARRGQTLVLRETFNWEKLSVIAGLTLRRFYFRIYEGRIIRACRVQSELCL